jgi:3D (Asp-Asp-Asp) domain-containing protein
MRQKDRYVAVLTAFSILMVLIQLPAVKAQKTKPAAIHTKIISDTQSRRAGVQTAIIDAGSFVVTAYAATYEDCGKEDGITRSGAKATAGVTIAADWSVLPCGTRIYIDGIGWRTVQDTGSAIRGNRIDIFFDLSAEAKQFGRQQIEIYVMK